MTVRTAFARRPSLLHISGRAACLGLVLLASPCAAGETGSDATTSLPETAVVFTGVPNRIVSGLRLLEEGKIRRLLISGISESDFVHDYRLSPPLAQARAERRLILGTRAQSTLDNAAETACWLRQEGLAGPILLITSQFHLPRATEALARAAPDVPVTSLGVRDPTDPSNAGRQSSEARKLVMTRVLRLLPLRLIVREGLDDCTGVDFR